MNPVYLSPSVEIFSVETEMVFAASAGENFSVSVEDASSEDYGTF